MRVPGAHVPPVPGLDEQARRWLDGTGRDGDQGRSEARRTRRADRRATQPTGIEGATRSAKIMRSKRGAAWLAEAELLAEDAAGVIDGDDDAGMRLHARYEDATRTSGGLYLGVFRFGELSVRGQIVGGPEGLLASRWRLDRLIEHPAAQHPSGLETRQASFPRMPLRNGDGPRCRRFASCAVPLNRAPWSTSRLPLHSGSSSYSPTR